MAKDGAFFGKQEPNRIIPRRPSHPTREGRRFFAAGTEGEDETDRGRYGDHRGAAVDGFGLHRGPARGDQRRAAAGADAAGRKAGGSAKGKAGKAAVREPGRGTDHPERNAGERIG